jgi:2-methylcitrate dehydratase PrpD
MTASTRTSSVAERLVGAVAALRVERLPGEVRARCEDLLLDVAGLCLAARRTDYVDALSRSVDAGGPCTVLGRPGGFRAEDAAMINGAAAHGEDFDDTFEGGPVHAGAVVVPAVLAACERFGQPGAAALLGVAVGVESLCRLALVAPRRLHDAGFHPTSVLGALAATLGVSAALGLAPPQAVDALGVAGSLAGGILEYLAEGAWTKRLHAGWAARAGLHAARMGREGFRGPRTVLEGAHGLFSAFARGAPVDGDRLVDGLGRRWLLEGLAFKPYATGTMNQPYIDCALRLRGEGFSAEEVAEVWCETAEGYVRRLWEPLASKHRPANAYAAKFSTPFNVAVAFVTGGAGLDAFTDETARDPRVLSLASKVRYTVDPANPYPRAYTGHVRMTLRDGRVFEERQPHLRGGVHQPLSRDELTRKFLDNAVHGGCDPARAHQLLETARRAFDGPLDLAAFRG